MKPRKKLINRLDLGWRITLISGVLFTVVLLSTGFYLDRHLESMAFRELETLLMEKARLTGMVITPEMVRRGKFDEIQPKAEDAGQLGHVRVTVIDPQGRVLADSRVPREKVALMDNHASRPEISTALQGISAVRNRRSMTLKQRMFYLAYPLHDEKGLTGVLRLSVGMEQVNSLLGAVRKPILAGVVSGLALVCFAGLFFGRSFAARFSKIIHAASRYAQGDFDEKIVVEGEDELRALAHSLNLMVAALKRRIGENEAEKAKLAAILGNMEEGVLAVDLRREVLWANASAEKIFEMTPGSASHKSLLGVAKKARIDEMMEQAIHYGSRLTDEIELIRDETKILRVSALGTGESEGVSGILVLSDITKVRRLEKMRREFVANVSHELRTPLTSIRGFLETLLGGAMEDAVSREKFLRIMEEDASRLSRLIDDLLELSRLEARQTPLNYQPVDLRGEADRVFESFGPRLREKSLRVENRIQPGSIPAIPADPDRIRQVLVNLVDNAIKFNRDGGMIAISAEVEGRGVRIVVADTGIGMPEHAVSRVFERFFRVDKARSREAGGTGLGLAIVKHIVEAHGGEVGCESEPDSGSRFFFTLPMTRQEASLSEG